MFLLSERYRLELHWDRVSRPEPGVMVLHNAHFSGPVMAQARELRPNDGIRLDFCSQIAILVHKVYVADLRWADVKYENNIVKLKEVSIKYDPKIKGIPNLSNRDYLVIDTKNHEDEKHLYNMLYTTYVISQDDELYDYRR